MGYAAKMANRACTCVALGVIATMLSGCEEYKMNGTFSCTDRSSAQCKAWKQESMTEKGYEDFVLNIDYTCTETSAQTGQCLAWKQSGSIKKETSGCFPGDAFVVTRAGPKLMSEVHMGDELLGYDHHVDAISFSTVRAWLHRDISANSEMVVLQTEEGDLIATSKHSIAVVQDGGHKEYVWASEVKVGDLMLAADGRHIQVTGLRAQSATGLYSPLTGHSNFFVGQGSGSAVLAHSFAHLWKPRWFEMPVHAIIGASEFISPTAVSSAESESDAYVHPWLRTLAPLGGVYFE